VLFHNWEISNDCIINNKSLSNGTYHQMPIYMFQFRLILVTFRLCGSWISSTVAAYRWKPGCYYL